MVLALLSNATLRHRGSNCGLTTSKNQLWNGGSEVGLERVNTGHVASPSCRVGPEIDKQCRSHHHCDIGGSQDSSDRLEFRTA